MTNASAVLQAAGTVGIRGFLNSGQTNLPIITRFDDLLITQLSSTPRSIAYTYDGLQRLLSATEGCTDGACPVPNTYSYTYDNAGNRLTSTLNGTTTTRTYNAANQISSAGFSYDAAGNLLGDGTSTYTYDALSRVMARSGTTFAYNGDGTLVSQVVSAITTRYTQDLASPLSQILGDGTNTSVYGMDRLYSTTGTRSWYTADALGSVRATLSDAGVVGGAAFYDPYGQVQSGAVGSFGFTGELQQGGNVYLRARWYNAANGGFVSRDPYQGMAETPYSLMPYQYAYSNPALLTDPSGRDPWWNHDIDPRPCPTGQSRDEAGRCVYYKNWSAPETTISAPSAELQLPRLDDRYIFTSRLPRSRPTGYDPSIPCPERPIFTNPNLVSDTFITTPLLGSPSSGGFGDNREIEELFPRYLTMDGDQPSSDGKGWRNLYIGADGKQHQGFDPANAHKPVKLGYDETLTRQPPSGYIYYGDHSWIKAGLVPLDSSDFWPSFYEAIKNTETINFSIIGMNVFANPNRYKKDVTTHREMDAILQQGYLNKLHLWDGKQELTGQARTDWIDKWKDIRGLP